jgi:hypothetical protein
VIELLQSEMGKVFTSIDDAGLGIPSRQMDQLFNSLRTIEPHLHRTWHQRHHPPIRRWTFLGRCKSSVQRILFHAAAEFGSQAAVRED